MLSIRQGEEIEKIKYSNIAITELLRGMLESAETLNSECMLKDNLKRLRSQSGYSQKQVAEYLNIERSTYTNYERGIREPSLDTIKRLAILFKTTTDEILEMENFQKIND